MAGAAGPPGRRSATDAPVARVAVNSQGRAVGVELEDGSLIRAKAVVSNAHPKTTYLDLVGEEHLPDDVVRDVRRYRTRSGSVKVNIGLAELPVYPAWDQDGDPHTGLIAVSPSMEYLERAFDDAKYGRASEHPYVEAVFPTAHEPGLAPEGKHIMLASRSTGPSSSATARGTTEREAYGNA